MMLTRSGRDVLSDPSDLTDNERAVMRARSVLKAKGVLNPSRERWAREAGLGKEAFDRAVDQLRACGLLPPSPLQARRLARVAADALAPGGRWSPADRAEIARRLAIVRAAKLAKAARCPGRETATANLDPHELDAVLPDVGRPWARKGGAA